MTCRVPAWTTALLLLALVLAVSQAAAQPGLLGLALDGQPGQTVVGMGAVTVERPPDALRMHVELSAKAPTLAEAIEKIKERREAATMQLEMLKADMKTVKAGNPALSAAESEQKKRMEQMIAERMRSRGQRVPPGLKAPQTVTVTMTLSVEWPLEAAGPEQLLLRAETIREKVQQAKLSGDEPEEELSAEEQELAEEMAMMTSRYGETPVKPGEPVFLFVSRIAQADREKAMADAFAKAKADAQSLAKAAGMELGPLVSLAGEGAGTSGMADSPYGYEYQMYIQRLAGRMGGRFGGDEGDAGEAVSPTAEGLGFAFQVRAAFALRPKE